MRKRKHISIRAGSLLAVGILAAGCASGNGSANGTGAITARRVTGPAPSGPAPTGYAPWPEAERDATHSSEGVAVGPQTGHIRWKAKLGGAISEGPSIGAAGTIYESNDAGVLDAINPIDGHVQWQFDGGGGIGGDLSTTAAVLPDGTIVWAGPRHMVFGLDAQGKQRWAVNVGGTPLSPVIAAPDQIYVMTTSGVLVALQVNGADTAPRWTLKLGSQSYGSPVIRDDGVIETTVDDCLVAVRDEGSRGRELWRFTVAKEVEVSPAVAANGTAILGTNDGFEYAVSPAGKQLWKQATNSLSYSSPAVTRSGRAYYGDNAGVMTAASLVSGSVLQSLDADPSVHTPAANIWTAPLVDSAGDVYYGTNGGQIYGYSRTGSQLFVISTGKTVAGYPALSGSGDLLIASDNGYLYSIGR
jgi:PQQ-like domain